MLLPRTVVPNLLILTTLFDNVIGRRLLPEIRRLNLEQRSPNPAVVNDLTTNDLEKRLTCYEDDYLQSLQMFIDDSYPSCSAFLGIPETTTFETVGVRATVYTLVTQYATHTARTNVPATTTTVTATLADAGAKRDLEVRQDGITPAATLFSMCAEATGLNASLIKSVSSACSCLFITESIVVLTTTTTKTRTISGIDYEDTTVVKTHTSGTTTTTVTVKPSLSTPPSISASPTASVPTSSASVSGPIGSPSIPTGGRSGDLPASSSGSASASASISGSVFTSGGPIYLTTSSSGSTGSPSIPTGGRSGDLPASSSGSASASASISGSVFTSGGPIYLTTSSSGSTSASLPSGSPSLSVGPSVNGSASGTPSLSGSITFSPSGSVSISTGNRPYIPITTETSTESSSSGAPSGSPSGSIIGGTNVTSAVTVTPTAVTSVPGSSSSGPAGSGTLSVSSPASVTSSVPSAAVTCEGNGTIYVTYNQRFLKECYVNFNGPTTEGLVENNEQGCADDCAIANVGFSQSRCYAASFFPALVGPNCFLKTEADAQTPFHDEQTISYVLLTPRNGTLPSVSGSSSIGAPTPSFSIPPIASRNFTSISGPTGSASSSTVSVTSTPGSASTVAPTTASNATTSSFSQSSSFSAPTASLSFPPIESRNFTSVPGPTGSVSSFTGSSSTFLPTTVTFTPSLSVASGSISATYNQTSSISGSVTSRPSGSIPPFSLSGASRIIDSSSTYSSNATSMSGTSPTSHGTAPSFTGTAPSRLPLSFTSSTNATSATGTGISSSCPSPTCPALTSIVEVTATTTTTFAATSLFYSTIYTTMTVVR